MMREKTDNLMNLNFYLGKSSITICSRYPKPHEVEMVVTALRNRFTSLVATGHTTLPKGWFLIQIPNATLQAVNLVADDLFLEVIAIGNGAYQFQLKDWN